MSRKGKVSVVQKTMKDPELIDMFNKMMGASDPDPNIVIPKYEHIHDAASQVLQLLSKLITSPFGIAFRVPFPKSFDELNAFVQKSSESMTEMELEPNNNILSGEELHAINSNSERMIEFLNNVDSKYKITGLGDRYTKLKESAVIKEMIVTARNLKNAVMLEKERTKSELHNLESRDSLSEDFILHSDGDYLTLFNFTSLDFKQIFYSDLMTEQFKKYVLTVLHFIYVRVMSIVKDITSPDIDVDKFSEVVGRNIDEMRKRVPRCNDAFDEIQKSVGLLKQNFGEYYKDFVTSQNGNPGIIVENFVLDVAKKNTANQAIMFQFRQIVNFYRQQVSGKKIGDPRIKKMLSLVGENLDILDSRMDRKKKPAASPGNAEKKS